MQIYNNRGYAANVILWRYDAPLASPPKQIKFTCGDAGDHGLTTTMFFYWDGANPTTTSFGIRLNGGKIDITKNASVVSWTTGTNTGGYGSDSSVTIDLTTDLITCTIDDQNMGHQVLTYSEVGMPNQNQNYVGVFTTNYIDNIYVR